MTIGIAYVATKQNDLTRDWEIFVTHRDGRCWRYGYGFEEFGAAMIGVEFVEKLLKDDPDGLKGIVYSDWWVRIV